MNTGQKIATAGGGTLAFMLGMLIGITSIMTIGGAAMCAMSIGPEIVITYSLPAIVLSFVFGVCAPKLWWLYSTTHAFLLLITLMFLVMGHEVDRFATCVLLIVLSLIFGFLGGRIRRSPSPQPVEGEIL